MALTHGINASVARDALSVRLATVVPDTHRSIPLHWKTQLSVPFSRRLCLRTEVNPGVRSPRQLLFLADQKDAARSD